MNLRQELWTRGGSMHHWPLDCGLNHSPKTWGKLPWENIHLRRGPRIEPWGMSVVEGWEGCREARDRDKQNGKEGVACSCWKNGRRGWTRVSHCVVEAQEENHWQVSLLGLAVRTSLVREVFREWWEQKEAWQGNSGWGKGVWCLEKEGRHCQLWCGRSVCLWCVLFGLEQVRVLMRRTSWKRLKLLEKVWLMIKQRTRGEWWVWSKVEGLNLEILSLRKDGVGGSSCWYSASCWQKLSFSRHWLRMRQTGWEMGFRMVLRFGIPVVGSRGVRGLSWGPGNSHSNTVVP